VAGPYASVVDVMLLLVRDGHVLLALRDGTGYADGMWNLPSGKLEPDEDLVSALIREAKEEIGVEIRAAEPRMVAAVHHRNSQGSGRVGFFFEVTSQPEEQGEPVNAEPSKCARIAWSPLRDLPANTYPYTAAGIDLYRRGVPFGLDGWKDRASLTSSGR
jgi:8-oxo-dGTP pyrophosphatase MutT (NUDIX family)